MDERSFHHTIGFQALSVNATTAQAITSTFNDVQATKVTLTSDVDFRYRKDGVAPTATVGLLHDVSVQGPLVVYGYENVRDLRIISVTGTATIHAQMETV